MPMLEVSNVKKTYAGRLGMHPVHALTDISFSLERGEFAAVMGESGSGKTTLLHIIATLDRPSAGRVLLSGESVFEQRESNLAAFRRDHLGFVFQDFNLLDTFSLRDNIFLPLVLEGKKYADMEKRLTPLAGRLGISDILDKYPYEVSGGQKQRCAIARALITEPEIILADEPTGALDSKATADVLRLMEDINLYGQTILMVTHSVAAASHAGRVLFIKDGRIYHQVFRGNQTNEEMYQRITDALTMLTAGVESHA